MSLFNSNFVSRTLAALWLCCLALAASPAIADWSLDNGSSRLTFVTIKNSHQGEVHRFYNLLGGVSEKGKVHLRVDMDSLRTGELTRDQRMHNELFQVGTFPYADIRGQLDLAVISNLAPGAQMEMILPLSVSLHQAQQRYQAELMVTRLDEHRFQVATQAPLILDAADFALAPAIDSLRQSVGLEHISLAVPVSAVLIFIHD